MFCCLLMEQKVLTKSPMVSRLPKFGARPVNGTPSPLPNGTTQSVALQEVKSPPAKPNGVVRASSFSLKWRKEGGGTVDPASPDESHPKDVRSPHSPGNKELKSPCSTKTCRSASSLSAGSPKPTPNPVKSSKSNPIPKQKPKTSQIITTSNDQDVNHKNSSSKPSQNGQALSSGLPRPRANSGSHGSSSKDSLSQSNDSLSRQCNVHEYMVRSQSFTHFKQLPSPTNAPMTRSFSFNKSVELAKPLGNTQLRPPQMHGLKFPQSLGRGRLALGLGGLRFRPGLSDQVPGASSPLDSLTPPSTIKRPLLPNSVLTKPTLQTHRFNRSIAAKSQCPLVVGRAPVENDVITPPPTPELHRCALKGASKTTDSPEEPLTRQEIDGNLGYTGEGPEDMSLSSASSLERNDTSDEFLDDFENPVERLQNGIPHNKSPVATSNQTCHQSFLDDTIGQGGGKADLRAGPPCETLIMSPDVDRHGGPSSLELSPSNSSGGTYMWDEEGMEPLGQNTHMRHCSSFESDLNSIDILNNLDNTGSCDLEEEDLMLDVDLPEDGALRSDGMAHFERSERGGRPAQWRRGQHRWTGSDHPHNDRLAGLHYDGFRTAQRTLPPAIQHDDHTVALDSLVLKHMADDCTSVKSQLLKLKSLLQMDDGEITPESLETSEDDSKVQQMEEMMKEVANLREELKKKDKIITQLTQRQQESPMRCHCHQQKCGIKGERRTHHDKSTQTGWRPPHHHHAPQILQPINRNPDSLIQGRVTRTVPTGVRSDAREGSPAFPSTTGVPREESRSLPDPEELSLLLSTHLRIQDNHECDSQIVRPIPNKVLRTSTPSFSSPLFLQRPRLHKRVTVPALPVGGSSEARPGPTMNHNAKALPPPTRGLPCISSGTHRETRGLSFKPWPPVATKTETVSNEGVSEASGVLSVLQCKDPLSIR